MQKNSAQFIKDKIYGTCNLEFVVDSKGNIRNVKATTMQGTKLAEKAIMALEKGPRWTPAKQNEHKVTSLKSISVTFKLQDNIKDNKEPA